MTALAYPASSSPGARPGEGSGRIVNMYRAKDGEGAALFPVPGMAPFALNLGAGPRGFLLSGAVLYAASADKLSKVSGTGVPTLVGSLGGSKPVSMARNNRVPVADVVIVSENGAFVTDGTTVADYPDVDVGSPNSVAFLDGYFLFTYGDATIRASGLNTTDINSESYTKAEAKPDGLLRGIVKGRQFLALGPTSTEFYDDTGASPFPLQRSEVVDTGLFGAWAVTGFEDGWDKPLFMVASDKTVRRWDGYTPTIVSTRDVERAIASVTDPSTLIASVYTFGGNSVVSLSAPGFTWEYHVNAGAWFERQSYGLTQWRGRQSVNAFGRWLVGDTQSPHLMAVDEDARLEGTDPLVCLADGLGATFPYGARIDKLRMDFSTGQGSAAGRDPIETDPSVLVSWSLDGGATWLAPLRRSLGRQSEYDRVVTVESLGRARTKGVRVRFQVSDPVGFSFRGADLGRVTQRRG